MIPERDALRLVFSFTKEAIDQRQDFEPFKPGVEIARLYEDAVTGSSALLLRYAPGATIPRHRHTGYEHVFVLSGAQQDDDGQYAAGTLLVKAPGSNHQVSSPSGCVVLIVRERPVEFLVPLEAVGASDE